MSIFENIPTKYVHVDCIPTVWIHHTGRAAVYSIAELWPSDDGADYAILVMAVEECDVFVKTPSDELPILMAHLDPDQAIQFHMQIKVNVESRRIARDHALVKQWTTKGRA